MLNQADGTLVVALATAGCIVIGTDSKKTWNDGSFEDNCKKLFAVGDRRLLAIAGFVECNYPKIPWLKDYVPNVIEIALRKRKDYLHFDEMYWDEEVIDPTTFGSEFWWTSVQASLQNVRNAILALDLNHQDIGIESLLVGFTKKGEAKFEKSLMRTLLVTESSGLPHVAFTQSKYPIQKASKGFIFETLGKANPVALPVLNGVFPQVLQEFITEFPAICSFLNRHKENSLQGLSEDELVHLVRELICATGKVDNKVGGPIQIGVIKPNEKSKQVSLFEAIQDNGELPLEGTWRGGQLIGNDYPYESEPRKGVIFYFCKIANNNGPINLGGNFFFGNHIQNTSFIYDGGKIYFEGNVDNGGNTLIIKKDIQSDSLSEFVDKHQWNISYLT